MFRRGVAEVVLEASVVGKLIVGIVARAPVVWSEDVPPTSRNERLCIVWSSTRLSQSVCFGQKPILSMDNGRFNFANVLICARSLSVLYHYFKMSTLGENERRMVAAGGSFFEV